MQTVLLAREIGRLIAWDGDSKNAVNNNFGKVGDIRRGFDYMVSHMGALTIDDVFRSVILAALKFSNNRVLRTAYDQILDDLDDDKDLTFAHIQTVCARQFWRTIVRYQGATPGSTSPRRHPARYAAHIAGQNRAVQQVQATRGQRTVSLPSSATHLKNMVNCLGRFSAEPASLAPSGTSLPPPSSWPPRNTSPRSPVTLTMTKTLTMTLPPPMTRMIAPGYFFSLWEAYKGMFFFSMFPQASYVEGTSLATSLSLPGTRVLKSASL